MLTVLMIISVLLIIIVLLQSGKAEGDSIITGGNTDLFVLTYVLGILFFVLCIIIDM